MYHKEKPEINKTNINFWTVRPINDHQRKDLGRLVKGTKGAIVWK